MSYLLQLIPTRAGYALENAALAGAGPAPLLDRMIVGGGTPLADPASATADNIGAVLATSVQAVRMVHSADAITGEAGFPEAGTYTITWAALLFDDGTPAAYGAFTAPFEKGAGWAYSLEWVLSRTGVGNLSLTVNIVDVNALREQLYNAVRADLDANNLGIAETRIKPVERAMHHVLRDGNPLMHLELFADPYNLRGGPALAISGVIAGDDSIDLAEHTETLLSGDYLIFGGGNTETVRLLSNLDLGRRRLQSDILHTYPTATLSRTNWTVTAGEAIALAGQVYYSKPLPLADNARTHRVIIRALTAAAAPVVAIRQDAGGGYVDGMLINTRPAADGSADYSDYLYDVVCADAVGHLRITTPAATRVRAIVLASVERMTRVLTAPSVQIDGSGAVPGQPVALNLRATSHLVNGSIAEFFVAAEGRVTQVAATNNAGVMQLALGGAVGETRKITAVAVDMLGNYSEPVARDIRLVSTPGWAATHVLSGAGTLIVPADVAAITVTGRGSNGIAPGSITSYSFTDGGYVPSTNFPASGGTANGSTANVTYCGPYGGFYSCQTITLYHVANGRYETSQGGGYYANFAIIVTPIPGQPGTATTLNIPGQPTIQFAGGAIGQAAVQSTELRALGAGPTTLTYNVPAGGYLKVEW